MNILKYNRHHLFSLLIIPLLLFVLSGCAEDIQEAIANALLKIDANNAEQVASAALDMTGAVDDADDILDAVVGTGTVSETVNCNHALLDPTSGSGTADVVGTDDTAGKDLTITYNNCVMFGYTINGSLRVVSTKSGNVKTGTSTGSLTIGFNGATFTLDNISYAFTKDDVLKDYSQDFSMAMSTSLLPGGSISIANTAPFTGNELNAPDKPVTGEMVVTGSGNTKVRLTVIDNTNGYNLDVDSNGDNVYDTQVMNSTGGLTFPW